MFRFLIPVLAAIAISGGAFLASPASPAKAACAEPTGCTCPSRYGTMSFPVGWPAHTDQAAADRYCAILNAGTR